MSGTESTGPYVVDPYGEPARWYTIFKIGPKGGKRFIAGYTDERTARTVANTLNAFHGDEA